MAQEFSIAAPSHWATLAGIVAVSLGVSLGARRWPASRVDRVARVLAVILVVYRTAWIGLQMVVLDHGWRHSLPLHICAVLFYLCAWMLWKRSFDGYEIAYFLGLGGTLQALVTPDVPTGFPSAIYLDFMLSHGALVFAVLYATFAFRFRPTWRSIVKALAATVGYAALLLAINAALGTNYMYLMRKPASATLLDTLGPWPWYIVAGVGVAAVSFVFWYLPFAIADSVRGRGRRARARAA